MKYFLATIFRSFNLSISPLMPSPDGSGILFDQNCAPRKLIDKKDIAYSRK